MDFEDYVPKEGYGIVYLYTLDNGERYVGQTKFSLAHRHKQHLRCNKMIIDRKLKTHDFYLEVLGEVPLEDLDALEIECITKFNTLYPHGLNLVDGGSVHTIPLHIRKKMSEASKGRPKSIEARAKMSETRKKMYENGWKPAFNGSMLSEESKKKMSETLKNRYKISPPDMEGLKEYYKTHDVWNKGVPCPDDIRARISNKLKGQKLSEETRRKMSESRKGKKHSQEWKDKVRLSSIASGKYIAVRCVETGEIFESISAAARQIGKDGAGISSCLKGRCKTCGGFHWEYANM